MTSKLEQWLQSLELVKYHDVFVENEVAFGDLAYLTEDDLKEMGLPIGPRRRLLQAVTSIQNKEAPAESSTFTEEQNTGSASERRQLTIMFCDLVGSTRLSQILDPEDLQEIIRIYQNNVVGEIGRYEGHVAKFMGDGILAFFGYPQAHEDDPERAIRSALSIVSAVPRISTVKAPDLQVRIGIATGQVVVGEVVGNGASQEESVIGITPNLAARLQSIASPGQIVISDMTKRLIGRQFTLRKLAPFTLKGVDGRVTAHEVSGERLLDSRFDARRTTRVVPLTGRDQELALLRERWRLATKNEGQTVLLSGEAGIGKSHITRALIEVISSDDQYRILYQCSPYHKDSALYPVIQQLTIAAEITPASTNAANLDKIEKILGLADCSDTEADALIAELVGLDGRERYGELDITPSQRRNRTLDVLVRQLVGLSRSRPVIFVVEDAHWIDNTTLELLDLCLDRITDASVLMVVTARPTFVHGFGGHPNVTRLTLNRLGRDHTLEIAQQLTDGKELPTDLLDEIVARTDGVPLFIEELTKALLESDNLTETEDRYIFHGPLTRSAIPTTLHDSLMARLDRMRPVKEVAQAAACIGRQFNFALLLEISDLSSTQLIDALEQLENAELLFRRGVPPDARYTFKHALVRDTAYESVLRSRRQVLHERIARTLEEKFTSLVETEPELVAHHFANAGDIEKGIDYWQLAAQRAVKNSAHRDAIEHLRRGLNLLPKTNRDGAWARREADLQTQIGMAYTATKGQAAQEVEAAYKRARKLCLKVSDADRLFAVLRGLWLCYQVGSRLNDAELIGQELLKLAKEKENSLYLVEAYRALGQTALWSGNFANSAQYSMDGVRSYNSRAHSQNAFKFGQDPQAVSSCVAGAAMWILGYPDRAEQLVNDGLQHAKKVNHPYTRAVTEILATFIFAARRDVARSRAHAEATIQIAKQYELPFFLAFGSVYRGRSLALGGFLAEGLEEARRGFDVSVPKTEAWWPYALIEVCLDANLLDEGKEYLEQALHIAKTSGDRLVLADVYRLQGELYLLDVAAKDREISAENCLRKALDLARDQRAKSWELRSAISLAKLLEHQGRCNEGVALVEPIYNWFTEGFETPDLREAGQLIDRLS